MNEFETETLLNSSIDDVRALDVVVAIRAAHWTQSGIVHPGQRREVEVGRRVELVCRLGSTRTWTLARRPQASGARLEGARLTADLPGLYVVTLEIGGFVRAVELVAVSTELLDKIGPRGAPNNRALTLRCRLNEPGMTTEALVASLEGNPPAWGELAAHAS